MNRRKFVRSSMLASGVAMLPFTKGNASEYTKEKKIIKPKRLAKGDTVGLIAPSSGVDRTTFERTLEHIDTLGFKAFYTDRLRVQKGFLAGTDKLRAEDVNTMFANDQVNGIVCVRGGYGSARILDMIDYDLIKNNPKPLIGYSDITALLYGIYQQTGLIGFHGPVGVSSVSPFNEEVFDKLLIQGERNFEIHRPSEWDEFKEDPYKSFVINPGVAKGQLIGGNLSVMVSLVGTPFDIDFSDKIVFMEEVHESPYRVDRMLTQLLQSGKFEKAAGIALGIFRDCDYEPDDKGYDLSLSLYEVLMDRFAQLKIPVMYGLPYGHIKQNATLPFGGYAELDTSRQALTITESPVL
ncbi:MAG: LD-carboxypeptidase [Cyclobacteriaceae bacterium]|nr:LD-carboxypeptidase [Cyclobacteriaceae bacterium]